MSTPNIPDTIESVETSSLVPYARNSRTHDAGQVKQIAASIQEFGFTNPVLIDAGLGIIAGHGRVMAAQQLGLSHVPCIRLGHLSDAQRRAYVIADNKIALNAGWDKAMLVQELEALRDDDFDMMLMGFDDDELASMLDLEPPPPSPGKDPESTPPVEDKTVSRIGDVWVLGPHRLVVGDSTEAGTYSKLMAGSFADVVWTDPPYNVAYTGAAGSIKNDDMSDSQFLGFLRAVFRCMAAVMNNGAAIYVAHADSGETGISFRRAFLDAGFKLAQCLIWRKDQFVLGRSDYQWIHEPILYGWKPGAGHKWYGGRKQTSVSELGSGDSPFVKREDGRWQITVGEETIIVDGDATAEFVENSMLRELKPKRSDLHPTMKPVALIERMIRNSAKPGSIVLDGFGGSGSTLIACERVGMQARLIELDTKFADVIVRRWQDFSGDGKAVLEKTGKTFDQTARQRR